MGYIYKIYNDINEKVYIGQTSLTVEHRFKEHLTKAKTKERENLPLYNAMKKYGIEHFFVETIEKTDNLQEREKYWIQYYDSYNNGYNATLGGEGNSKIDHDLVISLYLKYKNATVVANLIGSERHAISRILKSHGIEIMTPSEIMKLNKSKPIGQYDKDTLQIINIYPSAAEAGRKIGKSPAHIIKCANGVRQTAYGYKWKYIKEEEKNQ